MFVRDDSKIEHNCCWTAAIVEEVPEGAEKGLVLECKEADVDWILAALNRPA